MEDFRGILREKLRNFELKGWWQNFGEIVCVGGEDGERESVCVVRKKMSDAEESGTF